MPRFQLNLFDTIDVLPINYWRHPSECPLNPQQWAATLARKAAADAAQRAERRNIKLAPTLEQI